VIQGPALESLPGLEGAGAFDLIFIDADKPNCPGYFAWALRLARPGSLIIVDNVVRGGRVIDAGSADGSVQGVRRLFDEMAREPRVRATAIQTVGAKGYDGLAVAVVLAAPTPAASPAPPA
jgi:predicted O-methyltransferase YrrM